MTKLDGGTTQQERVFIGDDGELRRDRSNESLRLHDGETPGGVEFLNRGVADNRYLQKDSELIGLSGSDGVGYLVRVGEGAYVYRKLGVDNRGLEVKFASGEGGSTTFALASTIKSAHTFQQKLTAAGGIEGAVTGNLTGNVEGDVEGNLTGDSQGTHTGPVFGDVKGGLDARGEAIQLDSGALSIAHVDGLAEALDDARFALPAGIILLWSGSADTIPVGWSLCDGTDGTPNLTDRFVIGAGSVAPGATGGATTHIHTATAEAGGAHAHSVEVAGHALTILQMPAHTHLNGVVDSDDSLFNHGGAAANPSRSASIDNNSSSGIREGITTSAGSGQAHTHGATTASTGNHTHGLEVEAANNLPPYYALCYIMHTG